MTFIPMRNAFVASSIFLLLSLNGFASSIIGEDEIPSLSTNLTGFEIPFSMADTSGKYIEVQLYISENQGKDWQFYQSKSINSENFKFTCDSDGEYWFAMKTLDRDRQLIPGGKVVFPEMKITVDTVKPKIDFTIKPDPSGRVIAGWRAEDANLDTSTLKISYRGGNDQRWLPVEFKTSKSPIAGSYSDQIGWWPNVFAESIEVRFEIADKAGNSVTATRATRLQQSTIPRNNFSSTLWKKRQPSESERCPGGVCQVPPAQPNPQTANAKNLKSKADSWFKGVFKNSSAQTNARPPSQPGSNLARKSLQVANHKPAKPDAIPWESKTNKWVQREQASNGSTIDKNQFPSNQQEQFALRRNFDNVPIVERKQTPKKARQQVARQIQPRNHDDMFVTESTTMKAGKQAVPVTIKGDQQESQIWNDRNGNGADDNARDYQPGQQPEYVDPPSPDLETDPIRANPVSTTVPPKPVALENIERGSVPSLKANNSRFKLNYDVRAIDPSGVGRVILWSTADGGRTWNSTAVDPDNKSPMPVRVPAEGTYGFKVVINSRDGLTGKPPVSGDLPDVWVDVDWTRPQVRINSVPYGSGKDVGKLIVQFSAADENLAIRPIRLFYSPNPDGPWTTIVEGIRNSGTYAWKVPSQVPESVYLRIEARDTANNFAAYQLTSPVDLSGLVPRGRIYGVEPMNQ